MSKQKQKADDGEEEYKRYCDSPDCRTFQPVEIIHPTEEDYYGNEGSIIKCAECGQGLGHAVWWSEGPTGLTYD